MTKDVILFVNAIRPSTFAALATFEEETGHTFEPIIIVDKKIQHSITERNGQKNLSKPVTTIAADFDSAVSVKKALAPYIDRIYAVTAQFENCITELQKLVPYFPYLPMPTESSLDWATEKKLMRQMLEAHSPSLVPGYLEVRDASDDSIAQVEAVLDYPVIVKPSGLEGSLLVSLAHSREELQATLEHVFDEIQLGYDTWIKRQTPAVLVEEFMVGDMYSVDTYVSPKGIHRHTPPVKVVTGHQIGFDDFFGYAQMAPSGLPASEVLKAQKTAEEACKALGLRAVTAHVELMKTAHGWKIIELGPRIGGYRHDTYMLSYGINHIVNDIRNRAGEVPHIPAEVKAHTVTIKIYAPEEGVLEAANGIENVQRLKSLVFVRQLFYPGDTVAFAKNNGDPVFEICLSNSNAIQFWRDVRVAENAFSFQVRQSEHVLA